MTVSIKISDAWILEKPEYWNYNGHTMINWQHSKCPITFSGFRSHWKAVSFDNLIVFTIPMYPYNETQYWINVYSLFWCQRTTDIQNSCEVNREQTRVCSSVLWLNQKEWSHNSRISPTIWMPQLIDFEQYLEIRTIVSLGVWIIMLYVVVS